MSNASHLDQLFNFVEQLGATVVVCLGLPHAHPFQALRLRLLSPPLESKNFSQLAASRWSVQSSELPASYLIEMLHLFWTTLALT